MWVRLDYVLLSGFAGSAAAAEVGAAEGASYHRPLTVDLRIH